MKTVALGAPPCLALAAPPVAAAASPQLFVAARMARLGRATTGGGSWKAWMPGIFRCSASTAAAWSVAPTFR